MDFETATHLNALRRACRVKPIELQFMGLFILGNDALWQIHEIQAKPIPFGEPLYALKCRSTTEERTVEMRQSLLLQKLVLRHEIPARYPELLI